MTQSSYLLQLDWFFAPGKPRVSWIVDKLVRVSRQVCNFAKGIVHDGSAYKERPVWLQHGCWELLQHLNRSITFLLQQNSSPNYHSINQTFQHPHRHLPSPSYLSLLASWPSAVPATVPATANVEDLDLRNRGCTIGSSRVIFHRPVFAEIR